MPCWRFPFLDREYQQEQLIRIKNYYLILKPLGIVVGGSSGRVKEVQGVLTQESATGEMAGETVVNVVNVVVRETGKYVSAEEIGACVLEGETGACASTEEAMSSQWVELWVSSQLCCFPASEEGCVASSVRRASWMLMPSVTWIRSLLFSEVGKALSPR